MASFQVNSIQDLINIINPHFLNYPLLSQKLADFILFKQIVELMKNKTHLTLDGLQEIINIRASLNLGLSDLQKVNFPNTVPVARPIINTTNIPNPNWLAGFVGGEGCFDVNITKSKTNKIGHKVILRFRIYQHERDLKLMEYLIKYLSAGKIEKDSRNQVVFFKIYQNFRNNSNNYSLFKKISNSWCKIFRFSRLM